MLLFYIGAVFVILSINPWHHLNEASSPFVQVFSLAGIPIAAGIINFVVLTSAASAGNSGLFSTSRMLYNLGRNKQASIRYAKLNKNHVPKNGLLMSAAVVSLGVVLNYFVPEKAFGIATTISAICFIWVWSVILISHIRYKRTRPDLHAKSKFKAPLTPFINYVVLGVFAIVLIVMLFSNETRIPLLLTPIWFALLFITFNIRKKKLIKKGSLNLN